MADIDFIVNPTERILITGANGFIGSRVVETLLRYGFRNLRCFVRPSGNRTMLNRIIGENEGGDVELINGNLLSRDDCMRATEGAALIYHLAAGIDKSFPGAYLNSVVTLRNLLDATLQDERLKRFVNVSSFAVYSGMKLARGKLLDETCDIENHLVERCSAYCYGKVKQDELLLEYSLKHHLPYVIVRPGAVYGPGKEAITGRVGIGTFGIFLHMGGSNEIPFSYVDNCAEAIVLAGLKPGAEGETFNIVDDDRPNSKEFLRMYKNNVKYFKSISIPHALSYLFCAFWEKYSNWSEGQLPAVFNRYRWAAEWKGHRYSNQKLKRLLGWTAKVSFAEASKRYFEYARECRKEK